MSEMVEKVAMTLCHYPAGPGDTNSCCPNEMGQKRCQRQARAAIEAMREPTEAMVECIPGGRIDDQRPVVRKHWAMMIDEALK